MKYLGVGILNDVNKKRNFQAQSAGKKKLQIGSVAKEIKNP